ncbi:MAG: single-stranded DNA-binding protein [Clostridium sp.]
MNSVHITGRLVKDVELAFTAGKGTAVAKFNLAVDKGFGDNKKTAFIPVVVWGKSAEATANYTQKGSKVLINGSIETRSYDGKNGKVYVTEVVADMFGGVEFLDSKNSGGQANTGANTSIPSDYFGGGDMSPVDDGDMPF